MSEPTWSRRSLMSSALALPFIIPGNGFYSLAPKGPRDIRSHALVTPRVISDLRESHPEVILSLIRRVQEGHASPEILSGLESSEIVNKLLVTNWPSATLSGKVRRISWPQLINYAHGQEKAPDPRTGQPRLAFRSLPPLSSDSPKIILRRPLGTPPIILRRPQLYAPSAETIYTIGMQGNSVNLLARLNDFPPEQHITFTTSPGTEERQHISLTPTSLTTTGDRQQQVWLPLQVGWHASPGNHSISIRWTAGRFSGSFVAELGVLMRIIEWTPSRELDTGKVRTTRCSAFFMSDGFYVVSLQLHDYSSLYGDWLQFDMSNIANRNHGWIYMSDHYSHGERRDISTYGTSEDVKLNFPLYTQGGHFHLESGGDPLGWAEASSRWAEFYEGPDSVKRTTANGQPPPEGPDPNGPPPYNPWPGHD